MNRSWSNRDILSSDPYRFSSNVRVKCSASVQKLMFYVSYSINCHCQQEQGDWMDGTENVREDDEN